MALLISSLYTFPFEISPDPSKKETEAGIGPLFQAADFDLLHPPPTSDPFIIEEDFERDTGQFPADTEKNLREGIFNVAVIQNFLLEAVQAFYGIPNMIARQCPGV